MPWMSFLAASLFIQMFMCLGVIPFFTKSYETPNCLLNTSVISILFFECFHEPVRVSILLVIQGQRQKNKEKKDPEWGLVPVLYQFWFLLNRGLCGSLTVAQKLFICCNTANIYWGYSESPLLTSSVLLNPCQNRSLPNCCHFPLTSRHRGGEKPQRGS